MSYRNSYIFATTEEEQEEEEEAEKIMATAQNSTEAAGKSGKDQFEKLTEALAAERQKNADANGEVVTAHSSVANRLSSKYLCFVEGIV